MQRVRIISLLILLAGVPQLADATAARTHDSPATTTSSPTQAPLRSQAALQAYLGSHAGQPTPLDALPPLARQRFLDSLLFGRTGLGGFDTADLATELTRREVLQILELFDVAGYAAMIEPRFPDSPPAWRGQPETGAAPAAYDVLVRLQRAGSDPAQLRQRYDALLGAGLSNPTNFDTRSDRELVYLFRAAELIASDAPSAEDAPHLQAIVNAMARRGIARAQDYRRVLNSLLLTRDFTGAREFVSLYPQQGLQPVPEFRDRISDATNAPTLWMPISATDALERTPWDLAPTQILVIAGCHFSRDAAEDIARDPVLGPAFKSHAHWLMLPPGQEDPDSVREWNRSFPDAPPLQIVDRSEWPILPADWRMPTFLVVRNGKVVEQIIGWPRDPASNRQALVEALARHGLSNAGTL